MRLTSLADYAVVMMAAAARHPAGARLSATLLAEETGVPLPTAQKLISRLAAAGLLATARGTGGGFRLARPAGEISLADIIEAVEGPIAMTSCVEPSATNARSKAAARCGRTWTSSTAPCAARSPASACPACRSSPAGRRSMDRARAWSVA